MAHRGHSHGADHSAPLTPAVFHILLALSDGALHGYGIMQAVGRATEPGVRTGPGTIYGCLQRMEGAGLVEECGSAEDGKRRLFRLTPLGERALETESLRIVRLADTVRERGLIPHGV